MPGMRLPAAAVSTLLDLRKTDGRSCAVIRTDIASASVQAHTDWIPSGWLPDMTVTGATLAHFDIDRGVWLRTEWDLQAHLEAQDSEGRVAVKSVSRLASVRRLPAGEASAWRERIRAFDGLVINLYEPGGVTQDIARIGELKKKEADDDWLKGLALTLALIDPAHRAPAQTGLDMQGEARATSPPRILIEKADLAALAERWQDAAAAYIAVADTYPDDELAPQALAVAASICESRLHDNARSAALRERVLAWRAKKSTAGTNALDRAMELYRLASACAQNGAFEKAAAAYQTFLACRDVDLPGGLRVLAQYRLAGLDEQRGRRAQALAAYEAVLNTQAEDDYSGRLKEKSRKKITALRGAP
jgi:tetratricopeptide (TPR) repeat protein